MSYRATGFNYAVKTATKKCEEINVQAVLKERKLRTTKRHFSYEATDEPESGALKRMEDRFSSLSKVRDNFGVLNNFQNLDAQTIRHQCEQLGRTLSTGSESDIDWKDLVMELESLPTFPKHKMTALELLAFLHDKGICELYPNLWVALHISPPSDSGISRAKLLKATAY